MSESPNIDVRVLTSSRDLDDYDVLALQTISAAVPHETTDSFRRFIWGAMVTYVYGNKSIDHVLRRYDWMWERYRTHARELSPKILALRAMTKKVNAVSHALEAQDPGSSFGRICAKSALCRLEATFKAAYGLVRKEYIFETDAVVRLVLEQLAWSCVAVNTSDDDILSLQPTKCISQLKRIYPDAGRLYGELSEGAHIDASLVANYLRFHQQGRPVVRRSAADAMASGERLLELSLVYVQVVQHLFSALPENEYQAVTTELQMLRAKY